MISKPRGRRPVNLQILPSAMTVLSICAGLTSIRFALEHQPKAAMALIAAAAILDGLDGRVARILDAQSRMGEEIDSLADAVNFGVTPALVLYVYMLSNWPVGWLVVLLYAVCVVLRLARYNALQDDGTLLGESRRERSPIGSAGQGQFFELIRPRAAGSRHRAEHASRTQKPPPADAA